MDSKWVVGLIIFIYLLASLLPTAISSLNSANTSGWEPTQIAIWSVISIVILATIIIKVSE